MNIIDGFYLDIWLERRRRSEWSLFGEWRSGIFLCCVWFCF